MKIHSTKAFLLLVALTGMSCPMGAIADDNKSKSTYIVGGVAEAGYSAVGAMIVNGEQHCTGTLVAPTIVVTAAHCVQGLQGTTIGFFFGPNANKLSSGSTIPVSKLHSHPNYDHQNTVNDIAVLVLEKPASVTPIAPMLTPLPNSVIGKEALFIGYGLTAHKGSSGEKRSVWIPISELKSDLLMYETPGKNTCNGDSGGPTLLEQGGSLKLIGVTSFGDDLCVEYGANTRVDAFASFVTGFLNGNAPQGSGESPGGGQAGGGQSSGDPADHCEANGWYGDGVCDPDCPKTDSDCDDTAQTSSDMPAEPSDGDFCEEQGWYGDGPCDLDCPKPDSDCDEQSTDEAQENNSNAGAQEKSESGLGQPRSSDEASGCTVGSGGRSAGTILMCGLALLGLVSLRRRANSLT